MRRLRQQELVLPQPETVADYVWLPPLTRYRIRCARTTIREVTRRGFSGRERAGVVFADLHGESGEVVLSVLEPVPAARLYSREVPPAPAPVRYAAPALAPVGIYRLTDEDPDRRDDLDAAPWPAQVPWRVALYLRPNAVDNAPVLFWMDSGRYVACAQTDDFGIVPRPGMAAPNERSRFWAATGRYWVVGGVAAALLAGGSGLIPWRGAPEKAPQVEGARRGSALEVVRRVDDLEVRWNANSPPVISAARGFLRITDGGVRKQIAMERSELQRSTVLYTPLTSDVEIELQLVSESGDASTDVVRVLNARPMGMPPSIASVAETAAARFVGTVSPARQDSTLRSRQSSTAGHHEDLPTAGEGWSDRMTGLLSGAGDPPAIPFDTSNLARSGTLELIPRPIWTAPEEAERPKGALPLRSGSNEHALTADVVPPAVPGGHAAEPEPQHILQVQPKTELIAPRAVSRVRPLVPAGMRDMIRTEVWLEVRVRVGPDGSVLEAHEVSQVGPGLKWVRDAALTAARKWRFHPAMLNGKAVAADVVLKFHFPAVGAQWSADPRETRGHQL